MVGLAERLRRVSVAHDTGVQSSYPAPTIRGRGARGNTSVLHSEVGGSTPSVSTKYLSAKTAWPVVYTVEVGSTVRAR